MTQCVHRSGARSGALAQRQAPSAEAVWAQAVGRPVERNTKGARGSLQGLPVLKGCSPVPHSPGGPPPGLPPSRSPASLQRQTPSGPHNGHVHRVPLLLLLRAVPQGPPELTPRVQGSSVLAQLLPMASARG